MNQVTLDVQGIYCEHCANSIEGMVGNLNGVDSIKVYFDERKVEVSFNLNKLDLNDITDVIEKQFDVEGWELSKPYIVS